MGEARYESKTWVARGMNSVWGHVMGHDMGRDMNACIMHVATRWLGPLTLVAE